MELISPATINAKDASRYLGISYWLILDMAKKKQIPCIHAGDRVLFRKEALDNWMQDQESKSLQPVNVSEYGKIRKVKG